MYNPGAAGAYNSATKSRQKARNTRENPRLEEKRREDDLCRYSCEGRLGDLKYLLNSYKVNINVRTNSYHHKPTALYLAAMSGHEKTVKLLLQYGANVNMENDIQHTPLWIAARNNRLNIVKILLARNPTTNNVTDSFFVATSYGYTNIVAVLKEHDSQVITRKDGQGKTALHVALENNELAMADSFLLEKTIKIDETDRQGNTPLHIAVEKGHYNMVKKLIHAGADINRRSVTAKGETPLIISVRINSITIASRLIDAGADRNRGDNKNSSPLNIAARMGHIDMVRFLITKGVNINQESDDGYNPLINTIDIDNKEIYSFLLGQPSININFKGKYFTPLGMSAKKNNMPLAQNLLERGADVDLGTNAAGITPLMFAAMNSNLQMMNFLIGKGSKIDACCKKGLTALWYSLGCVENAGLSSAKLLLLQNAETQPSINHAAKIGSLKKLKILFFDLELEPNKNDYLSLFSACCLNGRLELVDYFYGIIQARQEEIYAYINKKNTPEKIDYSKLNEGLKKSMRKMILSELKNYEDNTKKNTLFYKKHSSRDKMINELKKKLDTLASNDNSTFSDVMKSVEAAVTDIKANKSYGARGIKKSKLYQSLNQSIEKIFKCYDLLESLVNREKKLPNVSSLISLPIWEYARLKRMPYKSLEETVNQIKPKSMIFN